MSATTQLANLLLGTIQQGYAKASAVQRRDIGALRPDWAGSVTLDQIDPASGIQSIVLGLSGTLTSAFSIESLEGAASSFSIQDTAAVTLERPDGTALLTAVPTTFVSSALAAFDGVVDFAGASGQAGAVSITAASNVTYVAGGANGQDAALLVGTGTVTLPVTATARVAASLPGNFVAMFDSQIAASVTTGSLTGSEGGSGTMLGGDSTGVLPFSYFGYSVTTGVQQLSFADKPTGWSAWLGVTGFDQRLGTLKAVNLSIQVGSMGSLSGENLGNAAASLHVVQNATIRVDQPGGSMLTSVAASIDTYKSLGAFDGALDDAGGSGFIAQGLAGSGSGSVTLGDDASLRAFSAAEASEVGIQATGRTTVEGPGALSLNVLLQAGAQVQVSYTYVPTGGASFDSAYYLAHNPDVAAAGVDPFIHYITYGWKEGRDPSALFDTRYYLKQNPDVAAAGVDPLTHFAEFGWHEGRAPSLLFDGAKYLVANPGLAGTGIDPLDFYGQQVRPSGVGGIAMAPVPGSVDMSRMTFLTGGTLPADPLVEAGYYDAQLGVTLMPGAAAAAQQAAWSYDATGWKRGLNPDALFDTTYYLSHNPDVAAAHVDPLLHYETFGWKEGRDPSAAFSTTKYLAANPDVLAAAVDPLLQYVGYGHAEGRAIFSA